MNQGITQSACASNKQKKKTQKCEIFLLTITNIFPMPIVIIIYALQGGYNMLYLGTGFSILESRLPAILSPGNDTGIFTVGEGK